jgi:hypothetical protein
MKKTISYILPFLLLMAASLSASDNPIIVSSSPIQQLDWGSVAPSTPFQAAEWPIPEQTLGGTSDDNTILQGGENMSNAFVIPSIPFTDDGTTAGYADDLTDPCGGTSMGPDVVYAFTPATNTTVNIHLCGTTFYSVLYVYQNDINTLVGCSSFSLICGYDIPRGALDNLALTAGNTYYIVVDGYYTSSGPYSIQVTEPPNVICPPTSIPEGEPNCGDGYVDSYNQGCSDTSFTPAFTPISIGDTICGISGIYNFGANRDVDWYSVTISQTQQLTFSVAAEFTVQIGIFYARDCGAVLRGGPMNWAIATAGEVASITANCIPGTYYIAVLPQEYNMVYACPKEYLAWLASSPSPPAPANDNCSGVTPLPLTPETPLTFTGDNTGATMDCIDLGVPETWAAFTITASCSVTVDYCGTTPAFGTVFIVMADACPCGNNIGFNLYTQYYCGDNNFTIKWVLPAGTYYYPILTMPGIAQGPYTIQISAIGVPQIGLSPTSFEPTVPSGQTQIANLAISNVGSFDLEYVIATTQNQALASGNGKAVYGNEIGNVITDAFGPVAENEFVFSSPSSDNGGEQILIDCPPGSVTELEACGDDFNGGCNSEPPAFESAALNTTICGTAFSNTDPGTRDTDWYIVNITDPTYLTIGILSDFPTTVYLMNAAQNCPPSVAEMSIFVDPNQAFYGSIAVLPGTYWVFAAPGYLFNMPCDGSGQFLNSYVLSVMGTPAWLYAVNNTGIVPGGGAPANVDITFDASQLSVGTYAGTLDIYSTDPVNPLVQVPVNLTVTVGGCDYTIGDINGNGSANGIDVTFGVSYFKGGNPPPVDCGSPVGPCPQGTPFYAAGDVNGNCAFNGIDITYYVAYLKGLQPSLRWCETCAPQVRVSAIEIGSALHQSEASKADEVK